MNQKPGFYITRKKGFHVTFANGWTVSVQFGPGNYSDNYDREIGSDEEKSGRDGSSTAEIAAWPADGTMIEVDGDTVQARQTPAQVLAFMQIIAAKP